MSVRGKQKGPQLVYILAGNSGSMLGLGADDATAVIREIFLRRQTPGSQVDADTFAVRGDSKHADLYLHRTGKISQCY